MLNTMNNIMKNQNIKKMYALSKIQKLLLVISVNKFKGKQKKQFLFLL